MQVRREACTSRTWLQVAVFLSLFTVTKQSVSPFECYLIRNIAEKEETGSGLQNSISHNNATNLNCSWTSHNIYTAEMSVEVNTFESVTLKILQNVSETVTYVWFLKKDNISYIVNGSECSGHICLELVRATERLAGIYELLIQSENSNYSIYFEVKIGRKPIKPYFTLGIHYVSCFSEGYPKPVVYWISCSSPDRCNNKTASVPSPITNKLEITQVENTLHLLDLKELNISCCAFNAFGRECSQLHTIDMMSNISYPEIFLKTGQTFVLRCWAWYKSYNYRITWDAESRQQMLAFNISYYGEGLDMIRVLFASIEGRKSRNITCISKVHPSKSQSFTVIDSGFIDMDTSSVERDIDPSQDFCLVVEFRAYPAVRCAWIHNSKVFPCSVITNGNVQSKSEFCLHEKTPGNYMFYVENDEVQLSKTFTLNLLQKPEVSCKTMNAKSIFCKSQGYPLPTWLWLKNNGSSSCKVGIKNGITEGPAVRSGYSWMSSSTLDVKDLAETVTICSCAVNSVGKTCAEVLLKHIGPKVWRKSGKAHIPSYLRSSVKFPQPVMVWRSHVICWCRSTGFYQDQGQRRRLPGNFRVRPASFCRIAFWSRKFHSPARLGTCPRCRKYQYLV